MKSLKKLDCHGLECAQNGHRDFPIAAAQLTPIFLNWSPPKRTLPTSHSRPSADLCECQRAAIQMTA